MIRGPPISTLFPYTTLFLSRRININELCEDFVASTSTNVSQITLKRHLHKNRSEEYTSELQSLAYLVCRLLLEKKQACSWSLPLMAYVPPPTVSSQLTLVMP